MGYVVISLVGVFGLWAISEWSTGKKIDILHKRLQDLEDEKVLRLEARTQRLLVVRKVEPMNVAEQQALIAKD